MASDSTIGYYAFMAGTAIALIAGLLAGAGQSGVIPAALVAWIPILLAVLGGIVGYLNIRDKDTHEFLIASLVMLALAGTAAGFNLVPVIGIYIASLVQSLAIFVAPAAFIVAIKEIWDMAKGM